MTNPIQSKEYYQKYVNEKSPNSDTIKNFFKAFFVGGIICIIGELISFFLTNQGLNKDIVSAITSISLIFIAALLTALNLYNKLGKFAGAGSIVPITGFANSVISPAVEYKSEGYVMGVGAKMFIVAGPILVFGITSSIIYGLIYYILNSNI